MSYPLVVRQSVDDGARLGVPAGDPLGSHGEALTWGLERSHQSELLGGSPAVTLLPSALTAWERRGAGCSPRVLRDSPWAPGWRFLQRWLSQPGASDA